MLARMLHRPALVLNRNWQPVNVATVARALVLLWNESARVGVLFVDGRYIDTLRPGLYAFWIGAAGARVVEIDMRETAIDVNGQEIMTSDKVSLRVNALVTHRIVDARKAVSSTDDVRQALYRETQLALRAVIGVRKPDADASAGTGSSRKDRLDGQPECCARRKRTGRARRQLVVTPAPLVRAIEPGALFKCPLRG